MQDDIAACLHVRDRLCLPKVGYPESCPEFLHFKAVRYTLL
jgi:hypothetical protein